MKKTLLLIPLLLMLGCGPKNVTVPGTPPVPDPPVVTLLKLTTQAALADQTASHLLVQLCVATPPAVPALSASTCSETAVYLRTASATFDKIILAANGPDEWPAIRVKVAAIIASAINKSTVNNANMQAALDALQMLVLQIQGVK